MMSFLMENILAFDSLSDGNENDTDEREEEYLNKKILSKKFEK